jgi:2-oxoisovalerate dehydrogenase E1 component
MSLRLEYLPKDVAMHPSPSEFSDKSRRIAKRALLSRLVEERLLSLFSEGLLTGTVHTCIGQEFVGATIAEHIRKGDAVFSNHRCHGHFLSITGDIEGLIGEVMGKANGVCGGVGGSQHLCKDGFYSNGIQGGIVPVAAGLALARKLSGSDHIAVAFIGDGTLGEGVLYESLNIASKWLLPLVLVLENNGFAQSTSQNETLAGDICARAESFGIKTWVGNTWNWQDLEKTFADAVSEARSGAPQFVRVDTFRLKAHSKGDDNRPREFVEPFESHDPLTKLMSKDETWLKKYRDEVLAEIQASVNKAKSYPVLSFDTNGESIASEPPRWVRVKKSGENSKRRWGKAINDALHKFMAQDPKMMLLGEDIRDGYGGAFKVTQGLFDHHKDRVLNTPISEAAIAGIGIGLAMEGYKPFVEIMFGDFTTLIFDQFVNHAAKFRHMYNNQVQVDVVLRTPMGGGRGYGPTHSQTLDKHFVGVPGTRVVAMCPLHDPEEIYKELLGGRHGPTLLIENKVGYTQTLITDAPKGFDLWESNDSFPVFNVKPQNERVDVTFIGYGGMSTLLVEAQQRLFDEHELVCQVIVPTQIYPFNATRLKEIIEATPYLVIVEEGQRFCGIGSELISQLMEANLLRNIAVTRIGPMAVPIPASYELEKEALITVEKIISTTLELVHDS